MVESVWYIVPELRPARTDDEPRFFVVGRIGDRVWAAVCVRREAAVRIISVRRARKEEVERYEGD